MGSDLKSHDQLLCWNCKAPKETAMEEVIWFEKEPHELNQEEIYSKKIADCYNSWGTQEFTVRNILKEYFDKKLEELLNADLMLKIAKYCHENSENCRHDIGIQVAQIIKGLEHIVLRRNRFKHLDEYPKINVFVERDYTTNDTDTIAEFTEMLGDDFVAELVADRSFLKKEDDVNLGK